MTLPKEFKCPNCGGDHYGSSQSHGVIKYHCHGHESFSRTDPKWPGWNSCGWSGTEQEFLNNLCISGLKTS